MEKRLQLALDRWEQVRQLPEDRMREQRWHTVLNGIDIAFRRSSKKPGLQKTCVVWLTVEKGAQLQDRSDDARWLGDYILMNLEKRKIPHKYLWQMNRQRTLVMTGVKILELRRLRPNYRMIDVSYIPKRRRKSRD